MELKKKVYLGTFVLATTILLSSCSSTNNFKDKQQVKEDPYNITLKESRTNVKINIISTTSKIADKKERHYQYTDESENNYLAGMPIILDKGKEATIKVSNKSSTTTNVHWHGLSIPNNQDGPDITLNNKGEKTFKITPKESGTFWVHSHYRPVETQVTKGMYAPIIIRTETDKKYDLDEVMMLGDIQESNEQNSTMAGMNMDDMDMSGSASITDTINGKKIALNLKIEGGQIGKLRFINASANNFKTIKFPFKVRVIAKDGYNLEQAYETQNFNIAPGQRLDVEVVLTGKESKTYTIKDGNAKVKLIYKGNDKSKAISPFIPLKADNLEKYVSDKAPDISMKLTEEMEMNGSEMKMREMINGEVFPNTETFNVKVGQVYKVQFENADKMAGMSHPMHIHGAHFQIISKNGHPTNDTTWYDTYPMDQGIKTDIAIKFDEPGVWMVHCHILNHEDNGMMTSFTAK
ncbi:multicopper oxidase family protein [Lactococcus lactis subsp. lactis]|uniref:multicopper oxidase family protein n=1 Tax=Lactococcus lactis TaxID=1358 RepID=UPI001F0FAF1C|nr:multicopper oxidase family protein [Lactococcus lactis]MDN5610235.1 multicopper oxidase family protein [Staphylococcus equorum]MCH5426039.1 multicopper oxidase family protein [Lactococcus lactis]MCT0030454.1 multicopper oxidase family protein [Lactococcus lactis subsp. lactis]MCT0049150.1 multicopper oxidase family protein [Lactococcus lactis subsp. lactis]MCT0058934.1 multicopper oxidase family protein [Lactococcus lactis subsp. lactis]